MGHGRGGRMSGAPRSPCAWAQDPSPPWIIFALAVSWLLYPLTARVIIAVGDRLHPRQLLVLALTLGGLQLSAYAAVFLGQAQSVLRPLPLAPLTFSAHLSSMLSLRRVAG
jgi:hypothetical protein